jgi:hypothetical protein
MLTKIISDRGPQFVGGFIKEVYKMIKVEGAPSTAYHPQTNGAVERVNQELETYIRMYINNRGEDWADWLAIGEFALNNRKHSTTGISPFYAEQGRHPRDGFKHPETRDNNPAAYEWISNITKARKAAEQAMEKAAEKMKKRWDKKSGQAHKYKVGDKVWLDRRNLKTRDGSKPKFEAKNFGPFTITQEVGDGAYSVDIPERWRVHPVFNEKLLQPWKPPTHKIQERNERPPPEILEEAEEYEVEEVLDERLNRRRKRREWLVKWKGYPSEENTWEPETNLKNAQDALDAFHSL